MRAVIYARYSSDLQREASIEDQVRECSRLAERLEYDVVDVFSDSAISGSTDNRPGLQKLLTCVNAGLADIVIAEALDRISRDQEHIAGIFKRVSFAQAKIHTIAEGEISELHIGLKGTMNALFQADFPTAMMSFGDLAMTESRTQAFARSMKNRQKSSSLFLQIMRPACQAAVLQNH